MTWLDAIKDFKAYMLLERKLSKNTILAYIQDIEKLSTHFTHLSPIDIEQEHIETLLQDIYHLGLSSHTQSRILSGIKLFYKFLRIEGVVEHDPSKNITSPKIGRKLPDVLSVEEIIAMIESIDLSHPQGHRNLAIIETLYATGIRVSELINLRISQLYKDIGMIQVIGKNNKERLVPIGQEALHAIELYMEHQRKHVHAQKGELDILFLNRRGKRLTRVMVFTIVKQIAQQAGINKRVSPHTFRHSFATHLVEGGADLRAVQELLGHQSITTTEIYSHINREYIRTTMLQYHPRA